MGEWRSTYWDIENSRLAAELTIAAFNKTKRITVKKRDSMMAQVQETYGNFSMHDKKLKHKDAYRQSFLALHKYEGDLSKVFLLPPPLHNSGAGCDSWLSMRYDKKFFGNVPMSNEMRSHQCEWERAVSTSNHGNFQAGSMTTSFDPEKTQN